ncbi:hypothetical protein [Shimia sagamensis]|uniref:Alpha/beta hydrolase family protein n=1 Tax=Shimia sagamensis TaxID=1566352 RepID=A0ABY1NJ35_9RHOB|nr:hypothetical protein [Shimia sagamensis]SMP10150.1 hypothetical protein SAMN06265373_10294 [Shimia sagamensis]
MAKDMLPLQPPDETLVYSTRSAKLVLESSNTELAQNPILLIPGPTHVDFEQAKYLVQELLTVRSQSGPPIYLLQWNSFWPEHGQFRFAPMMREMHESAQHLAKISGPPNLLTLGAGALLMLRAAADPRGMPNANSFSSLSFFRPTLEVQGRAPRFRTPSLPKKVSVIGGDIDVNSRYHPLFKRLTGNPIDLFVVNDKHWFVRTTYSAVEKGAQTPPEIGFAGNWVNSWLDWLPDREVRR